MSTAHLDAVPRPSAAMELLGHGVPLSLLLDLFLGPDSDALYAAELVPAPRLPSP